MRILRTASANDFVTDGTVADNALTTIDLGAAASQLQADSVFTLENKSPSATELQIGFSDTTGGPGTLNITMLQGETRTLSASELAGLERNQTQPPY